MEQRNAFEVIAESTKISPGDLLGAAKMQLAWAAEGAHNDTRDAIDYALANAAIAQAEALQRIASAQESIAEAQQIQANAMLTIVEYLEHLVRDKGPGRWALATMQE